MQQKRSCLKAHADIISIAIRPLHLLNAITSVFFSNPKIVLEPKIV